MNRFIATSTCIAFAFSAWASLPATSHAQSVFHPAGLNPGDEYRLVFVTEGTRDALSSSIADYNTFVTDEANAPNSIVRGLAIEWFAIASTSNVDAIENTGTDPSPPGETGVPIYLVDGQSRFAEHYDNLWDGDSFGQFYLGPLNLTQNGIAVENPINSVWTGSDYYGVAGGFGGPLGSPTPSLGAATGFNGRWINNNFTDLASERKSLYAISSNLVAIPEPSTLFLATFTAISCLLRKRR